MTGIYGASATGWATLRRNVLPGFAASDIAQGAPLCVASGISQGFIMATTAQQKPVGIARDWAIAGAPVAVYDFGNELRANVGGNGLGASISNQSWIGVVGTSQVTHPQSGVVITTPLFGPVVGTGSPVGYGNNASATWAVGVAYESGATGDYSLYRVEPQILSGQTGSN